MFTYADKDGDGKISYNEFQAMINPPKPPTEAQSGLAQKPSVKKVTIKTNEEEKQQNKESSVQKIAFQLP